MLGKIIIWPVNVNSLMEVNLYNSKNGDMKIFQAMGIWKPEVRIE